MEAKQTSQMVTWLDEERRKDKATITKLEERSSSQMALIEDQARRIHALENELVAMRTGALTVSTFDEAITRLRADFVNMNDQASERRETSEQEGKKLREMERESLHKALDELRQEMGARLERELQMRRAEEERLAKVATELQSYASNLSKGFEEFERSLGFLEEQRRQDSRRLSDINSETGELAKRTEGYKTKIELLEELSRRTERSVEQVAAELPGLKEQQLAWTQQEALAAQQREQVMSDMIHRIDTFHEDMEGYSRQFNSWSDVHRAMKKQVEDFDRLADRVDRRLNEVAEIQRLSEERFRQEWEEFLQDDQKRWRQFTLTNEETRREQQKTMEETQSQLTKLSEHSRALTTSLKSLHTLMQDTLRGLSGFLQQAKENADETVTTLPTTS